MNRDPLGERGGINLYAFTGNNPVNWVDPWGLICNIKSFLESRKTGVVKDFKREEVKNPFDDLLDSIPSGFTLRFMYEITDRKEQWAKYEVLIEICKNSCGEIESRTELSALKKRNTEWWVTIDTWKRLKRRFMGDDI